MQRHGLHAHPSGDLALAALKTQTESVGRRSHVSRRAMRAPRLAAVTTAYGASTVRPSDAASP